MDKFFKFRHSNEQHGKRSFSLLGNDYNYFAYIQHILYTVYCINSMYCIETS